MPLEVLVDIIPAGIEEARENIEIIRITQVEKLDDDPYGERLYHAAYKDVTVGVQHKRSDGAPVLAAKVLAELFLPQGWVNGSS